MGKLLIVVGPFLLEADRMELLGIGRSFEEGIEQ